ncbi:NTP transferase domain-containing protein [Patescibacteria group bacterium]|nr:NTP transferase domain-containing protein [Patescibacteria group bacterium]MBU1967294.1 NTP transferase domain-containing protein [Patescibacteria group bacterium]MBU2543249.1 NTP transferase domain-containing protein [Patescibacteria group bacterium]
MIKKAIITAAGYGTRFLPISKTIKKEMMPILNRPVLDYVVADCYDAGIEEIIFVTKERESIIQWYYSENRSLTQHLEEMHKIEQYRHFLKFLEIQENIRFRFVEQTQYDQYGTAIPVKIAQKYLQNEEAFLVLMGDDFIYNQDESSEVTRMIKTYEESGAKALMTCIEVPRDELEKYGVVETQLKNTYHYLTNLFEKPKPDQTLSNLANISKYILPTEVFDIVNRQKKNPHFGEYLITDTVLELAQKHDVVIHKPQGKYLDGGDILGWLKANLTIAWDDPALKKELSKFIQTSL